MFSRLVSVLGSRMVSLRTLGSRSAVPMSPEVIQKTAEAMSEILGCDKQSCLKMFEREPQIAKRSPEHVLRMTSILMANYDARSVVRNSQLLAQDWDTLSQRRYILEEFGLGTVNLVHIAVFQYIMRRSIYDLKMIDKMIPDQRDVIDGLLKVISDCPRSVFNQIFQELPASHLSTMPLSFIWKTFMGQYIRYRLGVTDPQVLTRSDPRIFQQSLRLMRMRLDDLLDTLNLPSAFILRHKFLLRADPFNLRTLTERVKHLSEYKLSVLAEREPRILLAKTEDVCQIESLLRSMGVFHYQVWNYAKIYTFDPKEVTERYKKVVKSPNFALIRSNAKLLAHVWNKSEELIEPSPDIKITKLNTANMALFKYLFYKLEITPGERAAFVEKIRLHWGHFPNGFDTVKTSINFLMNDLGFSREQLLRAPTLTLLPKTVIKKAWEDLLQMDCIKSMGPTDEWRRSSVAAEMLAYEIDSDKRLQMLLSTSEEEVDQQVIKANEILIDTTEIAEEDLGEGLDDDELKLLADLTESSEHPSSQDQSQMSAEEPLVSREMTGDDQGGSGSQGEERKKVSFSNLTNHPAGLWTQGSGW